jgi:hypothetical protein
MLENVSLHLNIKKKTPFTLPKVLSSQVRLAIPTEKKRAVKKPKNPKEKKTFS